jgi:hypothetical protein
MKQNNILSWLLQRTPVRAHFVQQINLSAILQQQYIAAVCSLEPYSCHLVAREARPQIGLIPWQDLAMTQDICFCRDTHCKGRLSLLATAPASITQTRGPINSPGIEFRSHFAPLVPSSCTAHVFV